MMYQQDLMVINYSGKKFCHLIINVRRYSFSQRVVNDWNSLPTEVVQVPDVESFKTKLDLLWLDLTMYN